MFDISASFDSEIHVAIKDIYSNYAKLKFRNFGKKITIFLILITNQLNYFKKLNNTFRPSFGHLLPEHEDCR